MKKHFIYSSSAILLLVCVVIYGFAQRYGMSERRVCAGCAITGVRFEERLGGIVYLSREKVSRPTPMSIALDRNDCDHEWIRYYFSETEERRWVGGKLYGVAMPGPNMLVWLLEDETLVRELSDFPKPTEKWRTLILAIAADPQLDESLSRWYTTPSDRPSLATWWETNIDHSKPRRQNQAR